MDGLSRPKAQLSEANGARDKENPLGSARDGDGPADARSSDGTRFTEHVLGRIGDTAPLLAILHP